MQFGGSHLAASLLAFNAGVELGQLFVLALAIPVLALLFNMVVSDRMGTIVLSAIVAHSAWHWMLERGGSLRAYEFRWPAFDAAFAVGAMRAAIVMIVAGVAMWLLATMGGRLAPIAVEREAGAE